MLFNVNFETVEFPDGRDDLDYDIVVDADNAADARVAAEHELAERWYGARPGDGVVLVTAR